MAIALDASTAGSSNDLTQVSTYSHTTGSIVKGVLVVGVHVDNVTDLLTSVTYNGVAMTRVVAEPSTPTTSVYSYLYLLLDPPSGAHDVVISISGGANKYICSSCASYSGVVQSLTPNASGAKTQAAATSVSLALTTTVDNCWLMGHASRQRGCRAVLVGFQQVRTTLRRA